MASREVKLSCKPLPQETLACRRRRQISCLRNVKVVKQNVQKFNGNPLEYLKFKAAFHVEVDRREVYDVTEKLKLLLDSVDGSAKSCLAKFIPGLDKYEEAWTALQERFGRLDTVLSAGKKCIDQVQTIVKESSKQIRQYQEIVSELLGIFKEHDFLDKLNSLKQLKSLKQLLLNFLHAFAVMGRVC